MDDVKPRVLSEAMTLAFELDLSFGPLAVIPEWELLLSSFPQDMDLVGLLAARLYATGKQSAAKHLLEHPVKMKANAAVLGVRSYIAHCDDDQALEEELIRSASQLDQDDYHVLLRRAAILEENEDFDAAVELLQRMLRLYPEDLDTYSELIRVANENPRNSSVTDLLDNPPAWFKESAQYWHCRGVAELRTHDFLESAQCFQRAIALRPEGSEYWSSLGELQLALSQFELAEESFNKGLSLNENHYSCLIGLSKIADRKHNHLLKLDLESKAYTSKPILRHMKLLNEAVSFTASNEHTNALNSLIQLSRCGSLMFERIAIRQLPLKLMDVGRWEDAKEALDVAVNRFAEIPRLQLAKIRLLIHEGDDAEVDKRLELMIHSGPITGDFYVLSLVHYFKTHNLVKIQEIIKIIQSSQNISPMSFAKCILMISKFSRKDALDLLKVGLSRYPNSDRLNLVAARIAMRNLNFFAAARHVSKIPKHLRPKARFFF